MSTPENACTDEPSPSDSTQPPAQASPAEIEEQQPQEPHPTAHESSLFPAGSGPRYFGTGSYATGGSNAEGNDGIGQLNSRGGYGSFTDAGGPGASTLYGEESPLDVAEQKDAVRPESDAEERDSGPPR